MAAIRKQGHKQITRFFTRKIDAQSWSIKIESEIERGVYLDQSIAQRSTLDGLLLQHRLLLRPLEDNWLQSMR